MVLKASNMTDKGRGDGIASLLARPGMAQRMFSASNNNLASRASSIASRSIAEQDDVASNSYREGAIKVDQVLDLMGRLHELSGKEVNCGPAVSLHTVWIKYNCN